MSPYHRELSYDNILNHGSLNTLMRGTLYKSWRLFARFLLAAITSVMILFIIAPISAVLIFVTIMRTSKIFDYGSSLWKSIGGAIHDLEISDGGDVGKD